VARQLYDAWGNVRYVSGSLPTDIGYTGQRLDNSTGLMYYRARYYAQGLGRFISADTLVPDGTNPQQFNRYAYGLNNPVKYTDPTGHCIFGIDTAICLLALIAATGFFGGAAIYEFNVSHRSWWESEEDAKATFSAGVEGATTAVTAAGIVADAAIAITGIAADYAIKTNNVQLFQWGASGGRLLSVQTTTSNNAGPARGKGPQLGDLTSEEIKRIQGVVDLAERPLEVIGSAARGERRNIGTDLPIGKGAGTRSDIDYLVPLSSMGNYRGLVGNLPSVDP
jgi:RHS repeat-associated protein